MYSSAVFSTLCTVLLLANAEEVLQEFVHNLCASKLTCHECIRTPSCAWCYDTNINTTKRCFIQSSKHLPPFNQCDGIYEAISELEYVQNDDLTLSQISGFKGSMNSTESFHGHGGFHGNWGGGIEGGGEESIVQIKPQRINLQLRAREVYEIRMTYARAEHHPVDLYYLMDLSKSMEDDKEKLSALGDDLAETMKRMTSKFTLGFGSFVDKVVMPYVSTIPEKLLHPCTGCVAPYGFRNHMTLSTNTNTFSQMVKDASVSGNLDAPEGGFDAIMQAVVCGGQIGWREKARRLLVFSTDAGFHYAGDGKLGGIVKPNDGECHLDNRGYYSMSSKQDYPSVSQINTYVKKNSINVIFAVTADKVEIYKQLASHIEGSTCGQLSNDSSNVVELIKEQYNAISSYVEMKHNASSDIQIKFFSKCLNEDGDLIETNNCNIKFNTSVEFLVKLQVLECPKDPKDWDQVIRIYPVGIQENLIINLKMLCDCPCEHKDHPTYKEKSPKCKHTGTYMCGICDCGENAYGPHCECSKTGIIANVTTANCINPKNGLECSGKGICVCGQCVCEPRKNQNEVISGHLCECDNFSCERHKGQLCSGHGTCDCNKCVCNEGWSGSNCACNESKVMCVPEAVRPKHESEVNETLICSGHGTCTCGRCTCEEGFYGEFCQISTNSSYDCDKYRPCVQCRMYKTGPYQKNKECESNPICDFHIIEVDVIEVNDKDTLCTGFDGKCRFNFVYSYNGSQIIVKAQKELDCPPILFLFGIILGVIAAVVLMGLAILLLWKLLTTIHDRREFAKFEKEAMMARWDTGENPIYKQATSTFKNPTYAGKG